MCPFCDPCQIRMFVALLLRLAHRSSIRGMRGAAGLDSLSRSGGALQAGRGRGGENGGARASEAALVEVNAELLFCSSALPTVLEMFVGCLCLTKLALPLRMRRSVGRSVGPEDRGSGGGGGGRPGRRIRGGGRGGRAACRGRSRRARRPEWTDENGREGGREGKGGWLVGRGRHYSTGRCS